MDYFENTTRVTEEGYAAILFMKRKRRRFICRAVSLILAIPFLERLIFYGILFCIGDARSFRLLDGFFMFLLILALYFWHLPQKQINTYVHQTKNKVDFQAVNQYTFLPEGIRMMTTSSLEKYQLEYKNLTWIRCDRRWIVLYFSDQDFTMLVDKQGFTHGTAEDCLAFLKSKQDGES